MSEEELPRALVAGKYRLTRLLGRGGMGSVWEGVHTTLGARVAVKFIDAQHAHSTEARSRFENEARAAAKLRSKYVVEVYDHGVGEDGRPFIVMEYLEGEPLDRRLDRLGRLPSKDAAFILQQVCRALAEAHAAGIVHRDLKPENIFLVWDDDDGADVAKVVDFGIAKFIDSALGPSSATRTGSVLGTPYYMSPEQARGLRSVDLRTDVWSLGVIAYRCIVGQLPFDGEAVGDLLVKLCTAPIPVPSELAPDVPPGFDAFIIRALAREPELRFQTAQELGASLCAVCGLTARGPYGTGEPGGGTGPYPAQPQAEVVTRLSSVAAVTAIGAATGAPLTQTSPEPPAKRRLGARIAAVAAALVVLGAGAAVLPKVFRQPESAAIGVVPPAVQSPVPGVVAASQAPAPIEGSLPSTLAAASAPPAASSASALPAVSGSAEPVAPAARPSVKAVTAAQALTRPRGGALPVRKPIQPSGRHEPVKPTKKPIDLGY